MTAPPIISQRQTLFAVPPLRRGRHSVAHVRHLPPSRIEIMNRRVRAAHQRTHLRAEQFLADRLRPEHLYIVRARAAKWSAIAVPVAVYVAVAIAALGGVR